MPNNAENWLTIEGQKLKVEEVINCLKGTWPETGDERPIDFSSIVPYPQEYEEKDRLASEWEKEQKGKDPKTVNWNERPKDGFNSGGIDWRCEHWGTKWGAYKIRGPIIFDPKYRDDTFYRADYLFETAWSAPTPWLEALARKFPDVCITCTTLENGCQFLHEFHSTSTEYVEEDRPKHSKFKCQYEGARGG